MDVFTLVSNGELVWGWQIAAGPWCRRKSSQLLGQQEAALLRKPGVVLMEILGIAVLCVSAYYNVHDIGAYRALAAECDHASDVRISEQISQRKHKVLHDSDDPNAWRRYLDMYR